MNGDRALQVHQRRLHPTTSTATLRDRRPVGTAAQQRRHTDSGGGQSAVFYDDNGDGDAAAAMATLLERFQQPAAAAPQPPDAVTSPCGDGSLRHHHHHQYHHHRHRPHHQQHQRGAAAKYNSVSAGSALSKSMRYADGWLYERDAGGTVGHGDGGRNRARSTFLGREHFGTATAAAAVAAVAAAAAATAAAANAEDPYDRVRKSRMAGAAAATKVDRKRNRSGSPRTPSPDYDEIGGGTSSRRSILECDVNPYDLLRQLSDDDSDGDGEGEGGGVRAGRPRRMSLKDKFMNRIQDTVFAKNRTGFGSFSSNGSGKKTAADRNSGGGAGGVNIAGHTVRLFDSSKSPTDRQKNGVTSSVWYDDGSASDATATTTTTTTAATVTVVTAQDQSPVRPPRRRCKQNAFAGTASVQAKRSHSLTAGTTPVFAEIKSILKKPASLTTDDLSPVRARTPPARPPSASTAGPTCNGSQKKTKKQVQFDIVSMANEKPTVDGGDDLSPDAEDFVKRIENAPPPPPPPLPPPPLSSAVSTTSPSPVAPTTSPAAALPTISLHRQDNQRQNSIGPAAVDDETTIVRAAVERKLKRSLSDRQNSCGTTTAAGRRSDGDVTVFNDTMRIHVRHKGRPDSRAAFDRPAEPPPPPPPQPPPMPTTPTTPAVTELFLRDSTGGDAPGENRTVVQVSPEPTPGDVPGRAAAEREQKTSILINSSPVLKTSVIIGEGGSAYAASSDNKVTISIGPGNKGAAAGNRGGNYRSNVTLQPTDRAGSRMSDFIRMNFDPVQAARLDVTPHVCGRGAAAAPLVSPYRVSEIGRRAVLLQHQQQQSSDTESSSAESCYASAKEDASYSSSFSSSSSSSSCTAAAARHRGVVPAHDGHCHYDATEPIYEEICDTPPPPPLPSCPPPDHHAHHGETAIPSRSIFEGATKYDIINYLVDAKRRCGAMHDVTAAAATAAAAAATAAGGHCRPKFVVVADEQTASESETNGACNDSGGEEYGCMQATLLQTAAAAAAAAAADDEATKKATVDIERNDSGVGSETSQSSRSKWQQQQQQLQHHHQQETQHGCEDCDQPVEIQTTDGGIMFAPLVCRKCHKRRAERREIIAEIVETEEKYGRDLDIITEEFYRPMMVAGLLNAEQLASVFLNVAELKEHSAALSLKLRDAYEIAVEQGDDDLLTVNIGRLFLEASPAMLHAFQSYCTRQGNAAMLLANLEKEKELLRIFLRVSQMENAVLRRMNLNSFLMVPVQRVTKYPLLLARLYKVTPEHHLEARQTLNEARHKIQLHLEHINSLAKDISSTKLWRKIYAINGKRPDSEDLADIKFRKVAVDVLEWSGLGEEIRFAMEGRLLYTQPSDHNWRRGGRTIKLMPINAIIVTLGKPNDNYNPDADDIAFPKQNGIRDASLVLLKEKGGRISLLREPMYLDRCVVCCESDWDDYFELHEITTKDTYILKGQDGEQTKMWYRQLQYHCQTLGCWRKRRNALANIMINRNCT